MLQFLKNDFARVHGAFKAMNDKLPTWLIVIFYILLFPIGILVTPFAALYVWIQLRKLMK